jgi:conjugative relaxase-like TrwC/TraI family protein
MLTIRKIRVASGDHAAAARTARYILDEAASPQAVARARGETVDGRPAARWCGTPTALARLGLQPGHEVTEAALARALQGRHPATGDRVRTEGLIHREVAGAGDRRRERVRGTKTVDLTFSAPKSVSVVWCQARPELRTAIEEAMLDAADAMLAHMTTACPVVAYRRQLAPARGFAAAAALHVLARAAHGEPVPAPQLHVHGVVVGVERHDGFFAAPELAGMYRNGAPLAGGAAARRRLAEHLAGLGFGIRPREQYFEIEGVPEELRLRMSGRARDVETSVRARERTRGKPLTGLERSVAALQTRPPKSAEAALDRTVAAWDEQSAAFGFGPKVVERLRQS